MEKFSKADKGITLIEIIVVIAVVAILALMAVLAFGGVQENARRTALYTDAHALATAINNRNAQYRGAPITAVGGIPTGASVVLTVPAVGMQPAMTFEAHFCCTTRRNTVVGVLTPPGGTSTQWRVDSALVGAASTTCC